MLKWPILTNMSPKYGKYIYFFFANKWGGEGVLSPPVVLSEGVQTPPAPPGENPDIGES